MNLDQKEIENIISALDYKANKMQEEMLSVRYHNLDERFKEIQQYSTLSKSFKLVAERAIDAGVANFKVPERFDVEKITGVKSFEDIDGANQFLIENKDIEVISLTPFLKNHGYKEYVLLYSKLICKESE